jgi:arginyl-tRNA synthetase
MRAELLKALGLKSQKCKVKVYPTAHADLTTNLPCLLAKSLKMSPDACALKLAKGLNLPLGIAHIEPTSNGLINFFFSDDYKTKLIQALMRFEVPSKNLTCSTCESPQESRILAWKISLRNFGLESLLKTLYFGQTHLSQPSDALDALQFFYLQCPTHYDLKLNVEEITEASINNPWYAVNYAIKRNCGVLEALKAKGVIDSNLVSSQQWPPFSEALLAQLLRFNWLIEDIKQHGRINELFSYTKNLASTIHCYYNKLTLLNTNPIVCSANFMLLQASQRVLTGGLKLLGVNVE